MTHRVHPLWAQLCSSAKQAPHPEAPYSTSTDQVSRLMCPDLV